MIVAGENLIVGLKSDGTIVEYGLYKIKPEIFTIGIFWPIPGPTSKSPRMPMISERSAG
jgi:hypothetical protein